MATSPRRGKAPTTSGAGTPTRTRRATAAGRTGRPPAWAVLVYLAGDIAGGHEAVRHDLAEILKAGSSPDLHLFVQHDARDGGSRYIVPASGSKRAAGPVERFDRLDSGRPSTLLEFLNWGLSLCRADRVALVIRSPLAISPADADRDPNRTSFFSIAYDQGSDNYLDVADLPLVIREALRDSGRDRLEIVAIDSCHAQFLELAYELEDIVRVLIGPQTAIPSAGWDYRRVLNRWKALAAGPAPASLDELATALVDEIGASYAKASSDLSVSALDLQRLDDVALAFDTMCIGTLQVMGEGLIWNARRLLLSFLRGGDGPVYDCGSFFAVWEAVLEAMADEAYQGWLGTTLQRASGSALDRFCEAVACHMETALHASRGMRPGVKARVVLMIGTLRAPDRQAAGDAFLKAVGAGVQARLQALGPRSTADAREAAEADATARDALLRAAIERSLYLLSEERRFDLERLDDSVESARRLAGQSARAALTLLGDAARELRGMVMATRTIGGPDVGWPRWSGASMYRPSKLDQLMNASYQRFKFHRRVHWAAMLGAANLIEQHPRALWRLVSSLLATGSAVTRRDVLRRLTGHDSVIWGLRNQFQVMAPAPTLTMSLERRARPDAPDDGPGKAPTEHYVLRLESVTRGAVINEQDSRVQSEVLNRALNELNALLQQEVTTTRSLVDLRSIGGLLGEDILQSLGRTLEEERRAIRGEFPDATPHLQLQIPRELMRYPWELMQYAGEWLGERYAIGRQVFMETGLARRVPGRRQGRVRPLVVGDPVFDAALAWRQLPGARREAEQVADWFERASREVGSVIDFRRERDTRIHTRLTSADMRALLRSGDYDIVHFAGHGVFRADDPETSAWLLSDGELWSLEIRNTLADHPAPPWLVYANACEAGMDAARPERRYQGNVFGLATAFINQGVAAYIAPLWPIDDLLAQHIALEFYRQLLSERATLGEALRRARLAARRASYPDWLDVSPDGRAVWAGLGWASLVLYGDPTEELFQAVAGGSHRQPRPGRRSSVADGHLHTALADEAAAMPATPFLKAGVPALLHGPDHLVSEWVRGPNWAPLSTETRGMEGALDGEVVLELIEDAGLRRWRVREAGAGTRGANGTGDGLPGSHVAALLADDRVRALLPARRSVMRVIGRWVLRGFEDGALGLGREYDRMQVPIERLVVVKGTSARDLVPAVGSSNGHAREAGARQRALLLVHGTFSRTASPVEGFGPGFLAWAQQRYDVVLGFDHWTLSQSPEDNARLLVEELRAFDPGLLTGGALDVITHSRGGLVARAFCELLGHHDAVRHLVFLGTPNCGTDLANPKNWGSFADLLVNMTGVDGAELFGQLAGLLAQLAVGGLVGGVPGLTAQSPASIAEPDSFLRRLQDPALDRGKVQYAVICAEFEPTALVPNLKQIVQAAAGAGADATLDALFATANDLVVNTAYAWGIACGPDEVAHLPKGLAADRVLVYTPPRTSFKAPAGTTVETALGVHHCNLFSQPRVQLSIKQWLADP